MTPLIIFDATDYVFFLSSLILLPFQLSFSRSFSQLPPTVLLPYGLGKYIKTISRVPAMSRSMFK